MGSAGGFLVSRPGLRDRTRKCEGLAKTSGSQGGPEALGWGCRGEGREADRRDLLRVSWGGGAHRNTFPEGK